MRELHAEIEQLAAEARRVAVKAARIVAATNGDDHPQPSRNGHGRPQSASENLKTALDALQNFNLRAARAERGLSQEEMAERLSMTVRRYRDWERGRWDPSQAVLAKIRIALKL